MSIKIGGFNMKTFGNVVWFIFYGFWAGIAWIITGALWCITIIGIPVGLQCFKFASLTFFPFKKDIEYKDNTPNIILNVLWLLFGGIAIALGSMIAGVLWSITIIGIPLGKQCFKIARLAIRPFGAIIVAK